MPLVVPFRTDAARVVSDIPCPNISCEATGMKYSEFKRWLEKQGARFAPGKGSHLHVQLNGRHSVFPFHGAKEMPTRSSTQSRKILDSSEDLVCSIILSS